MSHSQIYKFFNEIDQNYDPTFLAESHSAGSPVPYTIIDNFLPDDIFKDVSFEVDFLQEHEWTVFSNSTSYRKECRNFTSAPRIQTLAHSFQSSKFLKWLEDITGVRKLLGDPHYRGGGVCKVPPGSLLGLHTDFNWNDQIQLTRKVNLILYMNSEWNKEWGGELEFWNLERTKCEISIEPRPNRLVFWNYDEHHLHGHPHPLNTPEDIHRQNLILFYYSSNATHETAPHKSQFYG